MERRNREGKGRGGEGGDGGLVRVGVGEVEGWMGRDGRGVEGIIRTIIFRARLRIRMFGRMALETQKSGTITFRVVTGVERYPGCFTLQRG